jgi:hypothetical protein
MLLRPLLVEKSLLEGKSIYISSVTQSSLNALNPTNLKCVHPKFLPFGVMIPPGTARWQHYRNNLQERKFLSSVKRPGLCADKKAVCMLFQYLKDFFIWFIAFLKM